MRHLQSWREDNDQIREGHLVVPGAINDPRHVLQQPREEVSIGAGQGVGQIGEALPTIRPLAPLTDQLKGARQLRSEHGLGQPAEKVFEHAGDHGGVVRGRGSEDEGGGGTGGAVGGEERG